ncbi:MAG: DUF11 domain-containing protein [Candidatus Levybacteria bacterium]|nr:DUF11 domain-containing protein [Candidatus Levybacteria bacterium]
MNVRIPTLPITATLKMIKSLIFLPLFLTAIFLGVSSANASVTCENIYGGGQTCVSKGAIDIDKKVRNPKTGDFVDNLFVSESKHRAGDQVTFEIKVTNTGDATLSSVEVKDTIPQYTSFISGPGSFDANTKTLTYVLNDLKAKESRTDKLVVKVTNEGNFCVVNQSIASSEGMSDQDNSQFCIEKVTVTKGGLPVKPPPKIAETPPTGPEMLALIGLIPAGLAGILLRRQVKIK